MNCDRMKAKKTKQKLFDKLKKKQYSQIEKLILCLNF